MSKKVSRYCDHIVVKTHKITFTQTNKIRFARKSMHNTAKGQYVFAFADVVIDVILQFGKLQAVSAAKELP